MILEEGVTKPESLEERFRAAPPIPVYVCGGFIIIMRY